MKAYGEEIRAEMARVYRRAEELESALAEAEALRAPHAPAQTWTSNCSRLLMLAN
jgi:hypothetical protein